MPTKSPRCAVCPVDWPERFCRVEGGKAPKDCPTLLHKRLANEAKEELARHPDLREFTRQASIQEGEGYGNRDRGYEYVYPLKPRVQETVEFARRMAYERVGLTFCVGLRKEAAVIHGILARNGLDVVSVMCKTGRSYKDEIGITREQQVDRTAAREIMCNPIFQAFVANEHEVQLNVLLGLCVGHDSLFIQYAKAPVTVLAVKDRLLGHSPLTAVYQCDHYYRYLKNPITEQ
jgi:uncharacterized metal-binding protein